MLYIHERIKLMNGQFKPIIVQCSLADSLYPQCLNRCFSKDRQIFRCTQQCVSAELWWRVLRFTQYICQKFHMVSFFITSSSNNLIFTEVLTSVKTCCKFSVLGLVQIKFNILCQPVYFRHGMNMFPLEPQTYYQDDMIPCFCQEHIMQYFIH